MNKTLRISFSLRNTYRVNTILYSLKQIPIIKKLLPQSIYKVKGLKIFANVLSVIWEVAAVFLGKFLYFLLMVCGAGMLYKTLPVHQVFLHILFFLTVIGAFMNTHMFNPTRDKYYAMILMRMDARQYTLVNYGYAILKVIVGFLPFSLLFGLLRGVPLWICLLIPFSVAGAKIMRAAYSLWDYEKRGFAYNENKLSKYIWLVVALLLGAAYGLPAAGILIPQAVPIVFFIAFIPAGLVSVRKILSFGLYRALNQELLLQMTQQMDEAKQIVKTANEKYISADISITSRKKGFEYLNELFVKRHQKILWKAALKIAGGCCCLILGCLMAMYVKPEIKEKLNDLVLNWLPYFVFIMYAINRGTGFTKALFMNCDHSLLTYSFFKKPGFILKLFQIRLREIMKINAVPGIVIGTGLAVILYASGGTDNAVNYVVLIVSVICMSMFFSIHYLTIYYLLQPYNIGTEIKSGTYRVIMSGTYLVCYLMMKVKLPTLIFGAACIVFCILYSIVACMLVYRYAPKTFRLRT